MGGLWWHCGIQLYLQPNLGTLRTSVVILNVNLESRPVIVVIGGVSVQEGDDDPVFSVPGTSPFVG